MPKFFFCFVLFFTLSFGAFAQDHVARSNQNAKVLLDVMARFNPEFAGQLGVEGVDEKVIDLAPNLNERSRKAIQEAIAELENRLKSETDPFVKQDLQILIQAAKDNAKGSELNEKYLLPYMNVPQIVFQGIRALLDDRVPAERRPSALVRLKRYTGMEEGYKPVLVLAEERFRERLANKELLGPAKAEVERDLSTVKFFVDGIEELFQKYSIAGSQEPMAKLREQVAGYEKLIRTEVLSRARADFRLPPPLYQYSLEQVGIDSPAEQVAKNARTAFTEIQNQMQKLASQIAKEKNIKATDYRDVIREFKKNQLVGEAILPHYRQRIKEIEAIIQREKLVTLPKREMRIRLASEAESAGTPAPHMNPPRLIGNTGEYGEFVLPLNIPAEPGSAEATKKFDDFTFEAVSWTLTAHEGRPGHEMQFAKVIEGGVSIARAIFAFNSVNVEGWGLYAEAIMEPFEPVDAQLFTLQLRLMRAARAFLDPELQMGKLQPEEAKAILMNDVVLSDAMATQEVQRYTFLAPGQAPAYFYGYTKLMELRKDVEGMLGDRFDQLAFHDFVLQQGLIPPELLRKAVMDRFAKK